jgi:hypothetical protein
MMRVFKTSSRLAAAAAAITLLAATATATAATVDTSSTGGWNYVSAPKLHPPKLHTNLSKKGLASGFFFLSNFRNITLKAKFSGQGGPLIVDSHLQPVWFQPVQGVFANNLREQTYNGKPALSWWQGIVTNTGSTTQGTDVVVNQHYQPVASLTAAAPWVITQHEMIIQGHFAFVTANSAPETAPAGVTLPTGVSPTQPIVDSAVLEYDLSKPGSAPVLTWSALQHIPLSQSQAHPNPLFPWDAYHINSIQVLPGGAKGQLLVSMRNTWGAYLIDIATGNIVWTLLGHNGAGSTFTLPASTEFSWQHDVELHSGNFLTLFDDACCAIAGPGKFAPPDGPSRGLLVQLNTTTHQVKYVHEYLHPQVQGSPIETAFQGNMQLLPNKQVVVGWGSAPLFSEFTYSGKLLFDAQLPNPDVSYRAYVFNWVGLPPLSFMHQVAKKSHGKTTVYVSWDGATQVVAWRLLAGSSAKHLKTVSTTRKTTFETAIRVKGSFKTYKVQAVDLHGHVLGTSKAFGVGSSGGGGICNGPCGSY